MKKFSEMSGEELLVTRILRPEFAHEIDAEIERRAHGNVAKRKAA